MTAGLQGSLMVDVAGTWLTAEDRQLLRQPEVGGLIIFARNIEHPRQVLDRDRLLAAVADQLAALSAFGDRVGLAFQVLDAILDDARQSPSWSNTQPYRIAVATGALRDRLAQALSLVGALVKQVQYQAQGRFLPYAGQFGELAHRIFYQFARKSHFLVHSRRSMVHGEEFSSSIVD